MNINMGNYVLDRLLKLMEEKKRLKNPAEFFGGGREICIEKAQTVGLSIMILLY